MFADEFKHEVGRSSNARQRYCWRARLRLQLQTMVSVPEGFPMHSKAPLRSRA